MRQFSCEYRLMPQPVRNEVIFPFDIPVKTLKEAIACYECQSQFYSLLPELRP